MQEEAFVSSGMGMSKRRRTWTERKSWIIKRGSAKEVAGRYLDDHNLYVFMFMVAQTIACPLALLSTVALI
eukprot:7404120-Prorocentrum_lima.AAC.1